MDISESGLSVVPDSQLMESLYQTVQRPQEWEEFLNRLVRTLDARSARILFMNRTADEVVNGVAVNHDSAFMDQYKAYYVNKCPWRPELAQKKPGRLYSTYLDFSCRQQAFRQTEFYHDWARPQQIEHGICGTVLKGPEHTIQLLVQRTADAGHFTRSETDQFNNLWVPHIQNAIRLSADAEQMRRVMETANGLAETYAQPFALLDSELYVRYVSPSMVQSVEHSRGLQLKGNRLRAVQGHDNDSLYRLLRDASNAAQGKNYTAGEQLSVSADADDHLVLRVAPCPAAAGIRLFPGNDAFVAVFLKSDRTVFRCAADMLMAEFGLTRRESYLAMQLCAGHSLENMAVHDGVSVGTLRKQLKSIYQKTETHRQAQLVSLLLNSFAASRTAGPGFL